MRDFFQSNQFKGSEDMNNFYRIICFRNGSRNGLILITLFLVINSVSCGKQFVGRQVNTQYWCQINALPATCVQMDKWFVWEYSIDKGSKENEYILIGTADGSKGGAKSIGNIVPNKSRFSLIIANNGTVIDNIPFFLMGYDIHAPISFKRKFECQSPFNAAIIDWSASVRG